MFEHAQALRVAADELFGVAPVRDVVIPAQARIRKRLQRVEDLPVADQRAVLKFVDALVQSRAVLAGTS